MIGQRGVLQQKRKFRGVFIDFKVERKKCINPKVEGYFVHFGKKIIFNSSIIAQLRHIVIRPL